MFANAKISFIVIQYSMYVSVSYKIKSEIVTYKLRFFYCLYKSRNCLFIIHRVVFLL